MSKDTTKRRGADNKSGKRASKKPTKRKPPSRRLRARALAIINSDGYDRDTRASIRFQLKTNYSDLADMVRDAEQGVTICDTVMVGADQRTAARQVIALFELPGVPDFLTDAMMIALGKASAIEKIDLWKPKSEAEVFDPLAVTKLFAYTQSLSLKPNTPKDRVVEAVNEILTNPQTPGDLFEHVAEFVTETLNNNGDSDQLVHTSPMLSLILDACPEDESMGARHAAREAERAKGVQS